jgi:hypothetical protein
LPPQQIHSSPHPFPLNSTHPKCTNISTHSTIPKQKSKIPQHPPPAHATTLPPPQKKFLQKKRKEKEKEKSENSVWHEAANNAATRQYGLAMAGSRAED